MTWNAPGPGQWNLDRSHVNRPATPINQYIQSRSTLPGSRIGLAELGAPLDGLDFRFVNGLVYSRIRPLIRPDSAATKLPPRPILKIAVRLHPEMRRRATIADRALIDRPWRKILEHWHAPGGLRESFEAQNLRIQDVILEELSPTELVSHVHMTIDHALAMWEAHFRLHSHDLGPIGLLLDACLGWGFSVDEVLPLLEGASPSTSDAETRLRKIRDVVDAATMSVSTLNDIRSVSPDVNSDIEEFLRLRGRLIISRYDIDGLTLAESPDILAATILSARDTESNRGRARAEVLERTHAVRGRVPLSQQRLFDDLLNEARLAMDLRDDNGPHTVEWPLGLIRLALLEVGRRMVDRGVAHEAPHALELTVDEIESAVSSTGPGADILRSRREWRQHVDIEQAPRRLGPDEPPPPLEVLPDSMARVARLVQVVITEAGLDGEVKTSGLDGIGVGSKVYRGRARVASTPEDALLAMEPGDVLVVPCTTPAFNMVLSMAGAVITAEGGALSHAAVLARELAIPAVIGVPGALHLITDGALVEVDPRSGTVRLV